MIEKEDKQFEAEKESIDIDSYEKKPQTEHI